MYNPAPFAVLLTLLSAAAPATAGLHQLADQLESPQVTARLDFTAPVQLGRATITPAAGTPVYLLSAGDRACGIWIDGAASLTYAVEDRFSVPVAKRNLKGETGLAVSESSSGLAVREELENAVLWSWDLGGSFGGDASTAVEGLAFPAWASSMAQAAYAQSPGPVLLAASVTGAAGAGFAIFKGRHERLMLSVDPVMDRTETLSMFWKLPATYGRLKGDLTEIELVSQPIGRSWWNRQPSPLVAVHERIEVENSFGEMVRVKTTARLQAARPNADLWWASVTSGRLDRDHKMQPVTLESVKVDSQDADWTWRDGVLLVALPRKLAQGESVEVSIVNSGLMAQRPGNDNYWVLGTWPWYAQPPLSGELSAVEISVRVPEPFLPFASGRVISRRTADGFNFLETRLDKPVQFPVVAAGKFHLLSEKSGNRTVHMAAYAGDKERESRVLLKNFFSISEYFEGLFGTPYPFDEVSVIEINSWGFGQAPPGIIFITKEAFNPIGIIVAQEMEGYTQGVNSRFVHEVAHGWWGHVLKMDGFEEQWVQEGFAEYSAALGLQAMRGGGKRGEREFDNELREWKRRAGFVSTPSSLYLANRLAGRDDADRRDRIFLLYGKGPLVIHAIRQELGRLRGNEEEGERYFVALMRSFLKNFSYTWGPTEHLVGLLNQMTGTDWQPWFERYVYGSETPELR